MQAYLRPDVYVSALVHRQPDRLPKFRDQLVQLLVGQRMPVPKAMVQAGQSMGLSPNLINQWANQR